MPPYAKPYVMLWPPSNVMSFSSGALSWYVSLERAFACSAWPLLDSFWVCLSEERVSFGFSASWEGSVVAGCGWVRAPNSRIASKLLWLLILSHPPRLTFSVMKLTFWAPSVWCLLSVDSKLKQGRSGNSQLACFVFAHSKSICFSIKREVGCYL